MKIIHLPTDLGMRAYSLCMAERDLGLDSNIILRRPGVHNSGYIKPLYSSSKIKYGINIVRGFINSLQADVIMANQGGTWLDFTSYDINLIDLPIYSMLNKRIIVTYQGCDIRQCETCPVRSSLLSEQLCPNIPPGYSYKQYDNYKMKRYSKLSKYAYALLGITPDLCVLDGIKYTPHAKYIEPLSNAYINNKLPTSGKIRIAHMPRECTKGSDYIRQQISLLTQDCPQNVEYIEISGLSWEKCLETLATCHILIDQIIIGWYGGISVEAAMLGVLPITYINPDFLMYVPESMRNELPVLAINDKTMLLPVVKELINNQEILQNETTRCNKNAIKWHDAKVVTQDLVEKYYGIE